MLAIAALLTGLAVVQGWPVVRHAVRAADPLVFNDDARQQIVPFLLAREGVPADYASDYFLACLPLGFRALYRSAAPVIDPATLSKVLPYLLLLVTLAGAMVAGHRLGGWAAAAVTGALVLSSDVFLQRMVGGLPRGFAYPLVALAAAALASGRLSILAVVVVVAMAVYQPVALVAALALATALLVLPRADRGEASGWSTPRRVAILAVTGGVALAIHLPTAISCDRYGPVIGPGDVAAYPEAGPGGRYGPDDRAPYRSFVADSVEAARPVLESGGPRWITALGVSPGAWPVLSGRGLAGALLVLVGAGSVWLAAVTPLGGPHDALSLGEGQDPRVLRLASRPSSARRVLTLAAATLMAHVAASLVAPRLYLPERYAAYTIPLLLVLLVPACAVALGDALARLLPAGRSPASPLRPMAGAALAGAVLVLLGGHVSVDAGFGVRIPAGTGLYRYLGTLPRESLVAGWPTGPVDSVPYLSRRRAFLTFETHQALHRADADEMRRRTRALVDAYFATTWAPVGRLRDEFGVTHLIVDGRHLEGPPPAYFAPFDAWIAGAWARGRRDFVLRHPPAGAITFSEGSLAVLDLRRIPSAGSS